MRIIYHKKFLKQFEKLMLEKQEAVTEAVDLLRKNPFDPLLRNHPLRGDMKGQRSISAGFDLRIIFEEQDGYMIVIMIAVGKHDTVYWR